MADRKFKAVIFDMDGVLFDSERCFLGLWQEIAKKYNLKDIEKPFLRASGTTQTRGREIMLETYGADFPYEKYVKETGEILREKYGDGRIPLKKGAVELLKALKDNNKKTALATSAGSERTYRYLNDAGIADYFDAVICGDMVKKGKPDPDVYLKACEELKADPDEAYGIEDSCNGLRALRAGGLHSIMVPDLILPDEEMRELAEMVLDDLDMVREYLLN